MNTPSGSGSGKVPFIVYIVMLENGSGTHFGASQCISMDLAAASHAAAAARCVYTLNVFQRISVARQLLKLLHIMNKNDKTSKSGCCERLLATGEAIK